MAYHAAGSADIFTTEYMDEGDYDRSCASVCGPSGEAKPLLDDDIDPCRLGQGHYPRLVARSGETNVVHYDTRSRKILTQMGFMFHVLIGMRAWKLVVLFFMSYLVSYFVIGGVLWLTHDVSEFHGIHSYFEAVVFTGYTMTTVGFGNQYPKHPEAAIVPLISVVFALLMDAFWLGVIFARIATPRPLRHTVLFSSKAVVMNTSETNSPRDTFVCRVINLRLRYPWIDLSVRMTLSTFDPTTQNVVMSDLKVTEEAVPFLDIPWEIKHDINNDSPLFPLIGPGSDRDSFEAVRGEIIIELNGQDPLTGNCMKKRFSYCANEIFRNHKFVSVFSQQDLEGYSIDLTKFHHMEHIELAQSPQLAQSSYGALKE